MIQYLKKTTIYALASGLVDYELPACENFVYRFCKGVECGEYHICSQQGGNWLCISHNTYKKNELGEPQEETEIFVNRVNGAFQFHYVNGKLIIEDELKNTEGQNYVQSNSNCKSER